MQFFLDVVRKDRLVLDLVYGNYTFVNAAPAKHYGITVVHPKEDQWVRVDDAEQAGRCRGGALKRVARR